MSHAYGQVRFPDGTILHYEYDGTADICLNPLMGTEKEVGERWRQRDPGEERWCFCAHDNEDEEVEIATSYGDGTRWVGRACRKHRVFTENYDPGDSKDFDFRTEEDGLPEWWIGES